MGEKKVNEFILKYIQREAFRKPGSIKKEKGKET